MFKVEKRASRSLSVYRDLTFAVEYIVSDGEGHGLPDTRP